MPRQKTYPNLFEETFSLNIKDLKIWGYLKRGIIKYGKITWTSNQKNEFNIDIKSTMGESPSIDLIIKNEKHIIDYTIKLISIKSNLNRGEIWYFICPKTGFKARKLYLINGYFLHRKASKNYMYENQTFSKKWRKIYFALTNLV